jgi:alkaline phosphatase
MMHSTGLSRRARRVPLCATALALLWLVPLAAAAQSDTTAPASPGGRTMLRIVPPDRTTLAAGQRVDIRVEATSAGGPGAAPPAGLIVTIDGEDVTARNALERGTDGVRGARGTGREAGPDGREVAPAPANTTNFMLFDYAFTRPGRHTIVARAADGAVAQVALDVEAWEADGGPLPRARNVVFLLGDGMGAAHRTAARILSRGVADGKAIAPLAMDRMPVTGQVMTFSLNSVITDSAPGMASYSTGAKNNNNQEGVFPDNTPAAFDNPRVEYIGELLRRVRGDGFNVGIVTTSDVTDATPAANAVHTASRSASLEIASRFLAERATNGVSVLMGGGLANFRPEEQGGRRTDGRDLVAEFRGAGYATAFTASDLRELGAGPPPPALLGLFHPGHLSVAFDKVGAGRYSEELARPELARLRDQPMLDDMTRAALRSLAAHSPKGFYLMVEGASVDKQAHAVDAERTVWDTIEFDNAVAVALDFAASTNSDADQDNDTLVIVTADHECGGLAIIGVGNERYAPQQLGRAVRDYAAVFRFEAEQLLDFIPNYRADARGYPIDPDPSRKLLLGWAAAPDRFENWISNRRVTAPAIDPIVVSAEGTSRAAIANPARDSAEQGTDNRTASGQAIPGFLVPGTIENGAQACRDADACPGDTSSVAHTIAGHTGTDVPLSAAGPGMVQFTGTYDNTAVFIRMLRATTGSYATGIVWPAR